MNETPTLSASFDLNKIITKTITSFIFSLCLNMIGIVPYSSCKTFAKYFALLFTYTEKHLKHLDSVTQCTDVMAEETYISLFN